jgi:hypothetical protein
MKRTLLLVTLTALASSAFAQTLRDDNSYINGPVFDKAKFKKNYTLREDRSGWFDPAEAINDLNAQTTYFRASLFPDSSVLVQYSDGLGEVGWHSAGMICDPRSLIYEGNPFKLSRWNTYTVDSIAILYMYTRWNDDVNILDTVQISTFTGATDMLIYQNTALGTVAYNRPNNRPQGTTVQTVYRSLGTTDTSSARWGVIEIPVGRTVAGASNGGNWVGVGYSFIPGNKSYSRSMPFDTLDCRSFPNVSPLQPV